jgi:hypothetical protein
MIKYKKLSVTALVAVLAIVGVIGCGTGAASNSTSDGNTSVESTVSLTSLTSSNGTIEFDDEDLVSSYNASDCKKIDLSSGAVTITEAGTYIVSGTLTNGSLKVNYSGKETVRLIFNGVNITNSSEAPVIVEDGKKVIITLADGSTNTITDNRSTDLDDDYSGAISSKADLIFNGSGTLNITANHKNGIKSNDDLKIVSGTFNINSVEDGIIGKDCLCIKNGTFTVTAGDDGMKSTYDKDDTKGYIVIENGTFNITAGNDGIQSEHSLTIYDGTFTIKTGTGATESIQTSSNMNVNPGNRFGGDFKNGSSTTTTEDTESIKGIKAGGAMALVSGTFNIDSEDDALHSNDTILISGGTYKLASGDDGIHADSTVQIDNGTIVISTSYEGIEGAVINITGGDISVTSSDDGLNASDGSTTEGGGMFFNRGGGKTSTGSSSTSSVALNISGGKLYVSASGDGLDSNGSLNVSGGEIVVDGPTSSNDTALDYETSMTFTGGTIMAFGSNGMVENPTSASNGCAIVSTFTSQSAGSSFSLTDASGNVILSSTPSKVYSALIVYSPNIKSDTTYTITAGTYSSSVTTSSSIVTDGSNSGFGGFNKGGNTDGGTGKGGMKGQNIDDQTQDGTMQMPDGQNMDGNMQIPDGQNMDGNMQMPDGQSMDGNMQMPDGQSMDGNMQMPDGQNMDGNMQMPNQNQQGGGQMDGNGGSF